MTLFLFLIVFISGWLFGAVTVVVLLRRAPVVDSLPIPDPDWQRRHTHRGIKPDGEAPTARKRTP